MKNLERPLYSIRTITGDKTANGDVTVDTCFGLISPHRYDISKVVRWKPLRSEQILIGIHSDIQLGNPIWDKASIILPMEAIKLILRINWPTGNY